MRVRDSIPFLSVLAYACCGLSLPNALPQTKSIELRVIDGQTLLPVEDATVYFAPSESALQQGQTDVQGILEIDLISATTKSPRGGRELI